MLRGAGGGFRVVGRGIIVSVFPMLCFLAEAAGIAAELITLQAASAALMRIVACCSSAVRWECKADQSFAIAL
jgi:hypothetical protein